MKSTEVRFGTKVFASLAVLGSFILLCMNNIKFFVLIPIAYLINTLILHRDLKALSLEKQSICIFGFLELLIVTPVFLYEYLPTPVGLFTLLSVVGSWYIQIQVIKKIFLKVKNLNVYWIWNLTSPIWCLGINGYKHEGHGSQNYYGSILYVVGSIFIILFILKKKNVIDNQISVEEVERRKEDYLKMLNNKLIKKEDYEKLIRQLDDSL
jgi:hypothetical protein